jgi:hypothetical protein
MLCTRIRVERTPAGCAACQKRRDDPIHERSHENDFAETNDLLREIPAPNMRHELKLDELLRALTDAAQDRG